LEILTIDGKPYFPASVCAKILGYKNPRDAINKHCLGDGVAKRDGVVVTVNQYGKASEQTVEKTYINEGNLYRLIVRSKLPSAVRFERWVFDKLLPLSIPIGLSAAECFCTSYCVTTGFCLCYRLM
jgi:prophage antirepressor-like protein